MTVKPRGAYGIDAPWVPWLWVGIAVVSAALAVVFALFPPEWWSVALAWYFALATVVYLIGACLYLHASVRGKFVVWANLLADVSLAPGGRVLDLGCGRGAVAIMTARRFPGVEVTGIDLWRSIDQSGNSVDMARTNAALNDVAGRVGFDTGDMTDLPYPSGVFDLVTASMSIHNIPTPEGRRRAIEEGLRVLAPTGRIAIVDILRSKEYAAELRRAGLRVTGPTPFGWRGWWTGPWMATSAITATR